ncbi:hypothetical protein HYS48_00140 [Candidatus Woesearchaeota archaeon]|nr:hypothetical protein [Candidatus Woesearchaeota archaeon]
MTVISVMKFNEKEGAMIADEQATYGGRKAEGAAKIDELSNGGKVAGVMGGSGSADVLRDVSMQTVKAIRENASNTQDGKSLANVLGLVMAQVKRQYIDGYLLAEFGLREADFQSGHRTMPDGARVSLDQSIMQRYQRILDGHDQAANQFLDNGILLLTYDSGGVQLYAASMALANAWPISGQYRCIGSGTDMADGELGAFLETLPREKREHIDIIDGITALLSATERASARNIGVGGIPIIRIVREGKLIKPGEDQSKLAAEIVKATKKGYVSKEFQREALEGLIYTAGDVAAFEESMWREAGDNRTKLDRMLRGYRSV